MKTRTQVTLTSRCRAVAWAASVLGISVASLPALAQSIGDPATGLAVIPPSGYVALSVQPLEVNGKYTVSFVVARQDATAAYCRVDFLPQPENAGLTQEELNNVTVRPEWTDLIRAHLAFSFEIVRVDPFEYAGVRGVAVVGDNKFPQGHLRAGTARARVVVRETPKGRTNVICLGETSSFADRQSEFDAVVSGVTLPR